MSEYLITPVAKPRMTQRDKWDKRKCVQEYWAFKQACQLEKVMIYNGSTITFIIPMPPSWKEQKKRIKDGTPHTQRPDLDNLVKGILDSVFDEDSRIHTLTVSKRWGREGKIIIT